MKSAMTGFKKVMEEHRTEAEEHGKLLTLKALADWLETQPFIVDKHELLRWIEGKANE